MEADPSLGQGSADKDHADRSSFKEPADFHVINPLPTLGNSIKKQKSLYKVLTPSIKPPI